MQKVHVSSGQLVNPGQALVTLSSESGQITIEAKVPVSIAKSASKLEPSFLTINSQKVEGYPDFISSEATDGQTYSVIFQIPDYLQNQLTNGEFISIKLATGQMNTSAAVSFVPLDSVYQTSTGAFIYLLKGDSAVSQKVTLGSVLGSDVEIEGLSKGDRVILNRNIVSGDKVKKI